LDKQQTLQNTYGRNKGICEQTSIQTYIYLYPIVVWKSHALRGLLISMNILYRNLRTQQMSVLVLLWTFYTTCFDPVV
jgi:hypothetical protein